MYWQPQASMHLDGLLTVYAFNIALLAFSIREYHLKRVFVHFGSLERFIYPFV